MSETGQTSRAAAVLRRIVSAGGTQSLDELCYQVCKRRGAPLEGCSDSDWARVVREVEQAGLAVRQFSADRLAITDAGRRLLAAIDSELRRV